MKITLNLVAIPDEKVMVLNYRRTPPVWESGIVLATSVLIDDDKQTRTKYEVILDRRSEKGRTIIVTVGDDGIKKRGRN